MWAKNLGCFDEGEHRIDLAPLTVLVGPNNAGKSMMIAGFNLLRNLMFGAFEWRTSSYDLGNYASAVHNHDETRTIEVGATLSINSRKARIFTTFTPGGSHSGVSCDPTHMVDEAKAILGSCWYFRASRSEIPHQTNVGSGSPTTRWSQPLEPSGSNIINYLLERWTDQDPNWAVAQRWLGQIDPELFLLKSPLRSNLASLVTTNRFSRVDVNLAYQGTGIQKALAIMAAVIFSPPGSTIRVEEPEVHLHKDSQEVLADLFNAAANVNKQVIFSTHSWDLPLPYISDVAKDMRKRGEGHVRIDPAKFRLIEFKRTEGRISIDEYALKNSLFKDAQSHFGQLLG